MDGLGPRLALNKEVELIIEAEGRSVSKRDLKSWYEHSNEKELVSVSDWDDRHHVLTGLEG